MGGMRRAAGIAIALGALLTLGAAPASAGGRHHKGHGKHHQRHHHGHHGHHRPLVRTGIYLGLGPSYGWYDSHDPYAWGSYPPPVVVYRRPRVVIEEPPVYVERRVVTEPEGWWYYCRSEREYYPDVAACPEPWVRVAPRPD